MADTLVTTNGYEYTMHEDRVWITVKNTSVCIKTTDEGVVVDLYAKGREDQDAIASAYVFDSECEPD